MLLCNLSQRRHPANVCVPAPTWQHMQNHTQHAPACTHTYSHTHLPCAPGAALPIYSMCTVQCTQPAALVNVFVASFNVAWWAVAGVLITAVRPGERIRCGRRGSGGNGQTGRSCLGRRYSHGLLASKGEAQSGPMLGVGAEGGGASHR